MVWHIHRQNDGEPQPEVKQKGSSNENRARRGLVGKSFSVVEG